MVNGIAATRTTQVSRPPNHSDPGTVLPVWPRSAGTAHPTFGTCSGEPALWRWLLPPTLLYGAENVGQVRSSRRILCRHTYVTIAQANGVSHETIAALTGDTLTSKRPRAICTSLRIRLLKAVEVLGNQAASPGAAGKETIWIRRSLFTMELETANLRSHPAMSNAPVRRYRVQRRNETTSAQSSRPYR